MADAFPIRLGEITPAIRMTIAGVPDDVEIQSAQFSMPPMFENRPALIVTRVPLELEYQWQVGDTALLGTFPGSFHLIYSGGISETLPSESSIPVRIW